MHVFVQPGKFERLSGRLERDREGHAVRTDRDRDIHERERVLDEIQSPRRSMSHVVFSDVGRHEADEVNQQRVRLAHDRKFEIPGPARPKGGARHQALKAATDGFTVDGSPMVALGLEARYRRSDRVAVLHDRCPFRSQMARGRVVVSAESIPLALETEFHSQGEYFRSTNWFQPKRAVIYELIEAAGSSEWRSRAGEGFAERRGNDVPYPREARRLRAV